MDYFYGPVPSRRLGFSLGVDLFPEKICNFNCLYCQLGKTEKKVLQRQQHVDIPEFKRQLQAVLQTKPTIDYITISGSGEPTLHKNLDKVISAIKKIASKAYPVCVITNSSLLHRAEVCKELKNADLIIPSLDAADASTYRKINRPHRHVDFSKIIEGLRFLRNRYKGKIWLEIMLVRGVNDTIAQARKFRELISQIKPDKVQLNLPIRPPASKISPPEISRVQKIKKIIGGSVDIVGNFTTRSGPMKQTHNLDKAIVSFLRVRPGTLDDLIAATGVSTAPLCARLNTLLREHGVKAVRQADVIYFKLYDRGKC